jgi:hypothetical protein
VNEDSAERIVNALDAYLNMRELVAKSTEGWFTSSDVDEARRNLIKAVESPSVTQTSTPAERLKLARAAKTKEGGIE